jgi:ABC-2 type transport system ATP-binding protein
VNDPALVLKGVSKAFAGPVAVRDLSLEVPRGSVFGLLGPNGAGKTTTLRMVMNILGADAGSIRILGQLADHATRDRIGYMPEERGLYPRMVLEEQLLFMASIKGLPRKVAAERMGPWLERLGLAEWRRRKTNELSKGMQQKAQFIATVLHEPDVLIMDEPMSGLDPVGMDVMRDVMVDLSRRGATIVLSSHQMDTVEKLCDRVVLINKGEKVLDGAVSEVKAGHGKNTLVLAFEGDGSFLGSLPGVAKVSDFGQYVEIRMSHGADPQALLSEAAARLRIRRFEIVVPSLHDIFVETVKGHDGEAT